MEGGAIYENGQNADPGSAARKERNWTPYGRKATWQAAMRIPMKSATDFERMRILRLPVGEW